MKLLFGERSGAVGMKVVSVLLGAVAVAGVGSKPTFAKLVHLYFSNIYIYIYIYIYICIFIYQFKIFSVFLFFPGFFLVYVKFMSTVTI